MSFQSQDTGHVSFPDESTGNVARRLCLVARDNPLLFGFLTTLSRDTPPQAEQTDLVIDRRYDAVPRAPEVERRRASGVDDELRRRGFAFVAEPGETFSRPDAARIERTVAFLAWRSAGGRFRHQRPPVWPQIWDHRAWRTVGILGAGALIVTLLAAEFRMNESVESNIMAAKPSHLAPAEVAAPRPAVPGAAEPMRAGSAPAGLTFASVAPPSKGAAGASVLPPSNGAAAPVSTPGPAVPADWPRSPAPSSLAPLPQASDPAPPSRGVSAETRRAEAPRPSVPNRAARPAAKPAVAPSDLQIELSRKLTSATGGGVVFLVRVSDLTGQPLSDAEVSMLAGRRPGGPRFETRLHPTEKPGTYQSGVIHPSALPSDLTVKAIAGSRRVETRVER